MAKARNVPHLAGCVWLTLICLTVVLGGTLVYCQGPGESPVTRPGLLSNATPDDTPPTSPLSSPERGNAATPPSQAGGPQEEVVELRIRGHDRIPVEKIIRHIHTRANRAYDPEGVQEDVRRLYRTRMFTDVRVSTLPAPGGRVVIFEVHERPVLESVKYVGNSAIKRKTLAKQTKLKAGDPMDPYAVEEGRRTLEEYYQSKGFSKAQVSIVEGDKPSDRRAVYLIDEGPKQRHLWTQFIGNTVATDARLRTLIKSKPGFFWFFGGSVDRKQIDEDINRLTAYYRSLGFFQAQVGRELHWSEEHNWLTLTFVVNEGPRYKIRNLSIVGNTKFTTEELVRDLKLTPGEYFHQAEMSADVTHMQDIYGGEGYVFADVKADPRFLEEPGQIDLVYNIKEGERYRVGRINVQIKGEYPHTKTTTVLNRMSIRPGQIVDVRELRASERRLRASQLFLNDPIKGVTPKIAFTPPDLEKIESEIADQPRRPGGFRGQSPDDGVGGTQYAVRGTRDATGGQQTEAERGRLTDPSSFIPHPSSPAPRLPSPVSRRSSVRYQDAGFDAAGGYAVPSLQGNSSLLRQSPQAIVPGADRRLQGGPYAQPLPPPAAPTTYPAPPGLATPSVQPPQASPISPWGPPPAGAAAPAPGVYPGGSLISGPVYGNRQGLDAMSPMLGQPPYEEPPIDLPLNPILEETTTGRLMFSLGVNSDLGLLGSIIVDEQNFDWTRFPRGWEDIRNATAFRGAGQRFRMEAMPGTQLQRYTVNFTEPYLFDTAISLGLSGYYYDRRFSEWTERRIGGRVALGYQFRPDLSGTIAYRGESIAVWDPTIGLSGTVPPEIQEVVGDNALHSFRAQISYDTRDNAFLATEGWLFEIGFEQAIGSFSYPRGDLDVRKYFLLRQHPDGSGRHVLSLNARLGVSGSNTPVYEHYFAGGFSTIRGFLFRGASPKNDGVTVGGHFMLLASAEYMFPITADDSLRGVVFCDTGTVEPKINDWTNRYRVAPGFGLRITVPAMGPAPIALDFAFPVSDEPGDRRQVFSFYLGFLR